MPNEVLCCPDCGGTNVKLCFPLWVDANDVDNKDKWEMDGGAEPDSDSDLSFCEDCGEHVLLVKLTIGRVPARLYTSPKKPSERLPSKKDGS